MAPTLHQQRARNAWEAIEKIDGKPGFKESQKKDYGRAAKKLPVRALTAGLGQALAFLHAKGQGNAPLKLLMSDLSKWTLSRYKPPAGHDTNLLDAIIHGDGQFLRLVTDEALAWLQWLNRFAEAKGWTAEEE